MTAFLLSLFLQKSASTTCVEHREAAERTLSRALVHLWSPPCAALLVHNTNQKVDAAVLQNNTTRSELGKSPLAAPTRSSGANRARLNRLKRVSDGGCPFFPRAASYPFQCHTRSGPARARVRAFFSVGVWQERMAAVKRLLDTSRLESAKLSRLVVSKSRELNRVRREVSPVPPRSDGPRRLKVRDRIGWRTVWNRLAGEDVDWLEFSGLRLGLGLGLG